MSCFQSMYGFLIDLSSFLFHLPNVLVLIFIHLSHDAEILKIMLIFSSICCAILGSLALYRILTSFFGGLVTSSISHGLCNCIGLLFYVGSILPNVFAIVFVGLKALTFMLVMLCRRWMSMGKMEIIIMICVNVQTACICFVFIIFGSSKLSRVTFRKVTASCDASSYQAPFLLPNYTCKYFYYYPQHNYNTASDYIKFNRQDKIIKYKIRQVRYAWMSSINKQTDNKYYLNP